MSVPSNIFYCRVKDLLPVNKLPANLGFLKDGIESLFSNLYYKDLVIEKSRDGAAGYYRLTVVSFKRLALEVPGTGGLAFTLFPSQTLGQVTEVPLSLSYRWDILQFVSLKDIPEALSGTKDFWEAILFILKIDKRDLFEEAVRKFFQTEFDRLQSFADWFPYGTLTVDATTSTPYQDLIDQIEALNIDVVELIFDDILSPSTGFFDGLEMEDLVERAEYLLHRWLGDMKLSELDTLLLPQAHAAILNIPIAIEFPENILRRVDGNPGLAQLGFNVGKLGYSTDAGFKFENAFDLWFTKSEILNSGITLDFDVAYLDLSEQENITGANEDGRPVEFLGVHIPEATITFPETWGQSTGQGAELIGEDLVIGSEGGFSGLLTLQGDTDGFMLLELGPLNIEVHSFTGDIHQNNINALEFAGQLSIDGFYSSDTALNGQLHQFPFSVAFDDTGNTWTIDLQNSVPITLLGDYEILVSRVNVVLDSDGLQSATINATLTLDGIKKADTGGDPVELELLIEIVPGGNPELAITLVNSPEMKITFPHSIFVPVDGNDDPITDTGTQTELVFAFGTGAVYWDNVQGFVISSAEFISFTRSEVMGTGLIIDFEGGVIDLSKVTNIAQATAAGLDNEFVGAFIQQASITLPEGFGAETGSSGTVPMIVGQSLLFGNIGGFSGQLSLVGATGETLDLNFGGAEVQIESFFLDFDQSQLDTGSNIHGKIIIPGIKCADTNTDLALDVDVQFLGNGVYEVTAGAPTCPIQIASLDVTLNSLTLQFDRDGIVVDGTHISLTVALPTNETGQTNAIDVELQLLNDGFTLLATDTDGVTFPVGPTEVTLEYFYLEYHQNAPLVTNIVGSVFIPDEGAGTTIAVAVDISNTGYTLDMSSQPQDTGGLGFDVGGAEIQLTGFYLEIDRETAGGIEFVQSSISGILVLDGQQLAVELTIYDDGIGIDATALDTDGFCFDVASLGVCIKTFSIIYRNSGSPKLQSSLTGSLLIPTQNGTEELELEIEFTENGFFLDASAIDTDGAAIPIGGAELHLFAFSLDVLRNTDGTYTFDQSSLNGRLEVPANPDNLWYNVALTIDQDYYKIDVSTAPTNAPMVNLSWFEAGLYKVLIQYNKNAHTLNSVNYTANSLTPFEIGAVLKFEDMEDENGTGDQLVLVSLAANTAPDPSEWTVSLDANTYTTASPLKLKVGDIMLVLDTLHIEFTKNEILASSITGRIEFAETQSQPNGQDVILSGGFDDYGFYIIAEIDPAFTSEIAGLIEVSIHKIGIGRVVPTGGGAGLWYLQIGHTAAGKGLDVSLLQEIPMVNKFIPSGINVNSLKFYSDGSAEDADILLTWDGLSDEGSTPTPDSNGDISDTKQTNKGLANILTIRNINLGIKTDNGNLLSSLTLGGTIRLGPLAGTVEGVGVSAKLEFPNDKKGNLGPVNITDFKLVPPTGIGISFKSKAISGGGFLMFDYDNERYAGVLELSIKDKIAIKAVGLITTRLHDGTKGFSLLILITAEFNPIQLGLGFTLNGVGGLFGLHRTVMTDPLKEGIRSNTLDNILFPENPVENAMQIISDLREVFPPMRDRFVVGPMVLIGWGTPTLISAEIGVVAEITREFSLEKLIILGVVKAILPIEEKPILKIQINFIGIFDFQQKYITFDASIYDSRLLDFTLQGDMIFRLKYGDNSNFLMSVGGFHPKYTPPPLDIPNMKRLGIVFFNSSKTKLTMESFFAVTSNTVQFGARVDLYKKLILGLKVVGMMGFEALFQFNPFYMMIDFAASLAVRNRKDKSVLSVFLSLSLKGPHPWEASGTAGFKFLKKKVKVKVDITIGKPKDTSLPDIAVLPLFKEAFENSGNWNAELPQNRNLLVTMREIESAPEEVVAHPAGTMQVSQKVVPLNYTISKFGTQNPADYKNFDIQKLTVSGSTLYPADSDYVRDEFAPAHFKQMSQDDTLKSPSFEAFKSGVKVRGTDELTATHCVGRNVQYEAYVIDVPDPADPITTVPIGTHVLTHEWSTVESAGGPIAAHKHSVRKKPGVLFTDKVAVDGIVQPTFTIGNLNTLDGVADTTTFSSYAEAVSVLGSMIETDPGLDGELQIISGQTPFMQGAAQPDNG